MGCVNRCWIVDGAVRLIPPSLNVDDGKLNDVYLGRREALELLGACINSDDEFVLDAIQNAIEARIDRTDYTLPKRNQCSSSVDEECDVSKRESHYHIAAAALPASVHTLYRII